MTRAHSQIYSHPYPWVWNEKRSHIRIYPHTSGTDSGYYPYPNSWVPTACRVVHDPAQARKLGQASPIWARPSQAKPSGLKGLLARPRVFSSPSQAVKPRPKGPVLQLTKGVTGWKMWEKLCLCFNMIWIIYHTVQVFSVKNTPIQVVTWPVSFRHYCLKDPSETLPWKWVLKYKLE